MAYTTSDSKYVREIITNKLIPVKVLRKYSDYPKLNSIQHTGSPYFIECTVSMNDVCSPKNCWEGGRMYC